MTKEEKLFPKISKRGRETKDSKGRGSTKILKHTSRGSKLINLYVAFECALHMFACISQVLKFPIQACVVYARLKKMIDEIKTSMHRIARYTLIFYKWY